MTERFDLTPVALYARVSSDRQDVDLSIAAQLRALRDYAEKNDYLVAREYVDEAESGRIADRPEFQKMLNEGQQARGSLQGDSRLEILPIHSQARARRRLQVHAGSGFPIATKSSVGMPNVMTTLLSRSIMTWSRRICNTSRRSSEGQIVKALADLLRPLGERTPSALAARPRPTPVRGSHPASRGGSPGAR